MDISLCTTSSYICPLKVEPDTLIKNTGYVVNPFRAFISMKTDCYYFLPKFTNLIFYYTSSALDTCGLK
jgi:hypothetical protein